MKALKVFMIKKKSDVVIIVLAANQPQRTKLNERKKTQLATVAERLRRYREGRRVDGE